MKVIIAGSRSIQDYQTIEMAILSCPFLSDISEVVSGKARGVDTLAEFWAYKNNIPIKSFPANWEAYGPQAGPLRNKQMADYADGLILIWDGQSAGSRDMLKKAKGKGLQVHTVEVK